MLNVRARHAVLAFAVAFGIAPRSALAQSSPKTASVIVSARTLRIVYPRDTVSRWGPSDSSVRSVGYSWRLRSDAIDNTHSLALVVDVDVDQARTSPSLEAVIDSARVVRCDDQGMIEICGEPVTGTALVSDGRVEVTVSDSAVIADLFGLHPAKVVLSHDGTSENDRWRDSIPVRYVEPSIALPSDSLRARVVAARRAAAKRSHRVTRKVAATGAISVGDTNWVALGDTLDFSVYEQRCGGDVCTGSVDTPDETAIWSVDDTTVLGSPADASAGPAPNPLAVVVRADGPYRRVANRTGTTTLRVTALRPYRGDTATIPEPPPTTINAVVVVRRPAARVVIRPRPDTIRSGSEPFFRADVYDETGALIPYAPVVFTFPDSAPRQPRRGDESQWNPLPPNGRRRVVATYRARADTITVFVAGPVTP